VICWSVFISYEISITYILNGHFSPLLSYLLFYILNISIFYIHSLYILPFAIAGKAGTIWKLPLLIILEIAIYVTVALVASNIVSRHSLLHISFTWKMFAATVWRGIYFMLYGTGYFFLLSHIYKTIKIYNKAIEIERLKNQLLISQKDFLRAQINPHLLFNTLNFIKYASKRRPEDSDEAILILSDIMSFSLDENNTEYLPLSQELKQIENIIRLNQLRYQNQLAITYEADIQDQNLYVIPIVLLTLTENIFKHGNLLTSESPGNITIFASKHHLKFCSSNLSAKTGSLSIVKKNRGLKNIQARLSTYYPEKHQFTYEMNGGRFEVNLSIIF
jgi:two-component system LytT family sensor kinase